MSMYRKMGIAMAMVFLLLVMIIGSADRSANTRDLAAVNDQLRGKLAEAASMRERTEADLAWERSLGELRNGEVSNLKSKTADLETQKAKLQAERDGLAERAESLMTQVDAAKLDLDGVAKQLLSAGNKARDLGDLLKKRDEFVKSLMAQRNQILIDLQAGEARIALLEALLERQNGKVTVLAKEKKQLLQERADLKTRITDLSQTLQDLQQVSLGQGKEISLLSGFLAKLAVSQKNNPYRVIPICLAPTDLGPCSNDLLDDINLAIAEVQAWYDARLGKTFEWDSTIALRGEHPYAWYYHADEDKGGVRTRALAEVVRRLPQTSNDSIYLIFFRGWADPLSVGLGGGKEYVHRHGFFGDVVMQWFNDPGRRQAAFSVIAHELGHALSLQHDSAEGSIMNLPFGRRVPGFLTLRFTDENSQVLKTSPFLQ